MAILEGLFVYPLKSARGIALSDVCLELTGLRWDRHWMAVTGSGEFITQRTHPQLAQIVPQLTPDALVLGAPGQSDLTVSLQPVGSPVSVRVWDDTCSGLDQGETAARWLSQALNAPARLVRVAAEIDRLANAKYAGPYPVPVSFTDGFPILVCNRASLESLNSRMPEPVPMERFRPNVVLSGLPEFAEDNIDTLQIGDAILRLVKPCTRCIITSTDQRTGERTTNPLPVLRAFRFNRKLLGVTFGENAVVVAGVGSRLELGADCIVTPKAADPGVTAG